MKKTTFGRWWVIVLLLVSGCRGVITDATGTPATPVVTVEGTAVVESVEVLLLESFPVQVRVLVRGNLPDGCTALGDWRVEREGDTFAVTLPTTRSAEAVCTEALVPFEVSIPLEVAGLPAGTYGVEVNGVSASFTLDVDNVLGGGASYGRALALHQEGGLAGICRDFEFTLAGEVFISRCGLGAPEAPPQALAYGRLTAAELERLYALLDTTAPFEWSDPTAAAYDGLAQKLTFMGWGAAPGGEVEAQALIALAGELASRLLAGAVGQD